MYEVGYFYTIAQRSSLTVNLVQLSDKGNESPTSSVLRAMEEIENLEAEVLLLYTGTETIQLMLQKVHLMALLCSLQFCFSGSLVAFAKRTS